MFSTEVIIHKFQSSISSKVPQVPTAIWMLSPLQSSSASNLHTTGFFWRSTSRSRQTVQCMSIHCRNELHMERPSRVGLAEPTVTTKFKYIAVGWEAYLSGPALFRPSSVGPFVTNKAYTPHTLCLLSWCCIATFGDTCRTSSSLSLQPLSY